MLHLTPACRGSKGGAPHCSAQGDAGCIPPRVPEGGHCTMAMVNHVAVGLSLNSSPGRGLGAGLGRRQNSSLLPHDAVA